MSLVITQRPQLLTPVLNNMRVVVSGSNFAQPQFRYQFELFKGANRIGTFKSDLLPGNLGMCDLSETIKAEIVPQKPNINQLGWLNVLDASSAYDLNVYETYVSGNSVVSGTPATLSGTAFYGAFSQIAFRSYASGSYVLASGSASGFNYLTNAPRIEYYDPSDVYYIDLYLNATGATGLLVEVSQGGNAYNLNVSGTLTTGFKRFAFTFDYLNTLLQAQHSVAFIKGESFGLRLGASFTTVDSIYGPSFIYQARPCSKYDVQRVYFRNKLSGVDAYTFTMKNRKQLNAAKTTYGRNSDVYGTEVFEDVVSGEYQEQFDLTSDWLTDTEYNWLWELVTAPQVWLQINGVLVEAVIETENYRFITRKNDKLQPLQITLRSAYKNTFA